MTKYLTLSMELIASIDSPRYKHVSFIVKKNNILSIGVNSNKTHPELHKWNYNRFSVHSELNARLKIKNSDLLKKATMINIRLSSSSMRKNKPILRNAKPCNSCMAWLVDSGIKRILYSTGNGTFEEIVL